MEVLPMMSITRLAKFTMGSWLARSLLLLRMLVSANASY
jgi:hypothetical protein